MIDAHPAMAPDSTTSASPATALVAEVLAAWNARDAARLAALAAPDFEGTDTAEAGVARGPEGFRRQAEAYLTAFPDLHLTFDEVIADGDRVAIHWTSRGTHRGPFLHIPPTGRALHGHGVTLLVVEDGRIRRSDRVWDVAGFLRAVGLLPDLPTESTTVSR
ncbi:MAG TPA: ester cyclase [Rubricoccaceae bacterium]|nr:ester cyclase [Rubricoccaceae bacterium]